MLIVSTKMWRPIFAGLVCICTVYCGEDYSKLSETGILARIDLINSLKIALMLAKPRPTSEEQKAASEFVTFLNGSRSTPYLEAYYANSRINVANKVQQFFNGILYSGNPSLPVYRAAEILTKLMTTKLNSTHVEELRNMAKSGGFKSKLGKIAEMKNLNSTRRMDNKAVNPFQRSQKIVQVESSVSSRKQIDFMKVYRTSGLTDLKTLMDSVVHNLYGMS